MARLRIGAVLGGRYRIDARIADGGFGAVYRATYLPNGLEVALKILHAHLAEDPRVAERFRRESKLQARLGSLHTVATYERGELPDGTQFLAMELLHGKTLLERVEANGPVPWYDALTTIRAACVALEDAHAIGVVHRDLKPANLFLEEDGRLRVLDFGTALLPDTRRLTSVGQVLGTPAYMAPEQLAGAPCTPASDVYALGVIAFEMICGHRPFPGARNAPSLMAAALTGPPPVPAALRRAPAPVRDVVMSCLEYESSRRYASTAALREAIEQCSRREPRLARIQPAMFLPLAHRLGLYSVGAAIAAIGAAISWTALH